MLLIDFETRSLCDLDERGGYTYAEDPSTIVLMMAYWLPDFERVKVWIPGTESFPYEVANYARQGGDIWAWNAAFDRLIWDFPLCGDHPEAPMPNRDQWLCASAWARANGLPGKLTYAAEMVYGAANPAADIKHRGTQLIRRFSIPVKGTESFHSPADYPEEWAEFATYCAYDVAIMKSIIDLCGQPSEEWKAQYRTNERINDRGICIDLKMAAAATHWSLTDKKAAKAIVKRLAGMEVLSGPRITKWVYERAAAEGCGDVMLADNATGLTLDETARLALLDDDGLEDETTREVVRAIQDSHNTSVSKFQTMVYRSSRETDRVHGSFVFEGAGVTGRYSSHGVQMHNLARDQPEDIDATRTAFLTFGNWDERTERVLAASGKDSVSKALRSMLRPTIIAAEGHTFVCGDWKQIEGRVNPWLAADSRAQDRLAAYADPSRDIYCETASGILGRVVGPKDPERQSHGKVPELALGYGGGPKAFQAMAKAYDVSLPEGQVKKIVSDWRNNQKWAPEWWRRLERTAVAAMRQPEREIICGMVKMYSTHEFERTLYIVLPSGRRLVYRYARLGVDRFENPNVSFARAAWHPRRGEPWPRKAMWGGLICENITQAASADILRYGLEAMREDTWGDYLVGHTHDEMLLEVPEAYAAGAELRMTEVMRTPPAWAEGLPLAVDTWIGPRYRK